MIIIFIVIKIFIIFLLMVMFIFDIRNLKSMIFEIIGIEFIVKRDIVLIWLCSVFFCERNSCMLKKNKILISNVRLVLNRIE